jgi:uncharacterized protein YegJ (DUF2314 family)
MSQINSSGFPKSGDQPIFTLVSRDDPVMRAAFAKAAATIPRFIALLGEPNGFSFSAKLRFRDPDESERLGEDRFLYLWLSAVHYHSDEKLFSGTFFEVPPAFKKWHQLGKRLGFDAEDIFDWMALTGDGRLLGGYTIRVTRSLLPETLRADYDDHVGVRIYEPEGPVSRA